MHDDVKQDIHSEQQACPLYTAVAVIEGRWKPMIYQRLRESPRGFGELRRAMPGITQKVLREQLRQLIADDLVAVEELEPRWRGNRYRISAYGVALGGVFETLWHWGKQHLARPTAGMGTRVAAPRKGAI
jgi:DNA-binding HxlR family transcriptional regulator